jgi:hypothetical protein
MMECCTELCVLPPLLLLQDAAAVVLNAGFINRMEALEMRFFNRNRCGARPVAAARQDMRCLGTPAWRLVQMSPA